MNHFCREASKLASDAHERQLGLIERLRLRLHLWMCAPCNHYSANLRILNGVIASMRRHADENAPCLSDRQRRSIGSFLQKNIDNNDAPSGV